MNNARKTINHYINDVVLPALPGWTLITGDEDAPVIGNQTLAIKWIGPILPGLRPESRRRLCQLEVFVNNQNTDGAETACNSILQALNLFNGSNPILPIAKKRYVNGVGTPDGSFMNVRTQAYSGWMRVEPPQQAARLYILTLEIDFVPG